MTNACVCVHNKYQRCYGNSKFKKRDLMDIRDMESRIFTLSPSSTVENPSRFVKERLKLGIAYYSSHLASPRSWKIAIPRLSLSFTHRDGFSTVEDGESVKNSYCKIVSKIPIRYLFFKVIWIQNKTLFFQWICPVKKLHGKCSAGILLKSATLKRLY